ncbi:xanthine dehydrogenase family protein molybdopterin-binding subunit [Actinopolymorpha pittospori]|uniref:Xanthine dehydrogenase YagR molybdenum-binding subunit n=1 Tax=Actinopolymorpha pittospori TaxID=648752 RepID=A0A927RI36_9ACTN|nr:xanthine dehydrogenase YagR molybdenum-binding subunit [Actinopolymorpha pittospori]
MSSPLNIHAIGLALPRLDGPAKVTGAAPYAYEHVVEHPAYLFPVQASIARGRVVAIDTSAAAAVPGVLDVMTHENAPRLASDGDLELWVLQSDQVFYRGQFVAAVTAESPETARHAAGLVRVDYAQERHDVVLNADSDELYVPGMLTVGEPTDSDDGDLDAGLAAAEIVVDQTYTTPMEHNNPMEPHAVIAAWHGTGEDARLTIYCGSQGVSWMQAELATMFGLEPSRIRMVSPYVGGGFGSKAFVHPDTVLAALAAQRSGGRPVKLALTRQQMFAIVGYRTSTIQRVQLGADRDGRLTAIAHEVVQLTSRFKEWVEQTALSTRTMYAAPNRRTKHRVARLDLPQPTIMRAPGECPGMFATEVAMDELAVACGLDPIELRIRNEPDLDPDTGLPFSGRHVVECYREGARRFGWEGRDPTPRVRREHGWLVGTGMAASTYPAVRMAGSAASIRFGADGCYVVQIAAADIGTGTWTTLTQVAADALAVPVTSIDLRIGDTALPPGSAAGRSSGMASWGSTIVAAACAFRDAYGTDPPVDAEAQAPMPDHPEAERYAAHSFGAQFAEVRVHADTGEIRVSRMLGVFDAGRIVNPRTARSQFVGGMTMGISMALHENSRARPAVRPRRQPGLRRVPHRRERRHRRDRRRLDRRTRPASQGAGCAWHR